MSDSMQIDVSWIKELPVKEIKGFENEVVYTTARNTLDFTIPHIPYLTGKLRNTSLAFGVKGQNMVYSLGAEVPYAKYVWNYDQDTTNWTNPRSYSKWFYTEFRNQKETILNNAVRNSYKNWS